MIRQLAIAAMYTFAMFALYAVIFALIELTAYGGSQLADVRRLLVVVAAVATLLLLRGRFNDAD